MLISELVHHKIIAFFLLSASVLSAGVLVIAATAEFDVTLDVVSPVAATVQWAIPQGRWGASSTNWDTVFYITIRTATDGDNVILDSMPVLASTTPDGAYSTPITFNSVSPGTYDVCFKSNQHLSSKLNDVVLTSGGNVLNFTQPDNSPTTGTVRLLAGDINRTGNSTTTLGDDVVNSVDLDIMLTSIDVEDPGGNGNRANLTQDSIVNSVDASLLLDNLDKEGSV